ncbi:MAG: cupredoxin domain-containing protein [Acidobacteriota bacterium]
MKKFRIFLLIIIIAVIAFIIGRSFKKQEVTANPYERIYPMPHQYWQEKDEFYVFASGGQQGGIYVYTIPTMKLLQEIPIFEPTASTGWTLSNPEVKKMLTNPWTGEVAVQGDTHHPVISKTDGIYDGRWLFINDKVYARVARVDLSTYRTAQIIWVPNVRGGMHGAHISPDSGLLVANIELEQYPNKEIIDYLAVPTDFIKGPYVSCLAGIEVSKDGTMKNAWQIWGPWQFDMVRVGWGVMDGWFVNTAYNTERSVNVVGMFQRPEDYIFFWNINSIKEAVKNKKYITTKEAPDVPVISWKDVEVYAVPCPLNPHGVDVSPTGKYAVVGGKATTIVRTFDFEKVKKAISDKRFTGEEFGVKIIDKESVSVDIDAGLGPTHVEFDNKGFAYVGFFVDSDVKKITLGPPYSDKHKMEPWQVVETIPCHYSVGHLLVPGGDMATPYGKYLIIMNKLTKDTFVPHGPLFTENHELFNVDSNPARLIDQMPLPPETHYSQAIPVSLLKPKVKKVYQLPKEVDKPSVQYDYAAKEVRVKMTAVRSFFTPDWFTVPSGWKVKLKVTNIEQAMDISHGISFTGHDVLESIEPGEAKELVFSTKKPGVFWYYCLWFCSELHLEMRGRMIVIPESEWNPSKEWKPQA